MKEYFLKIQGDAKVKLEDDVDIKQYIEKLFSDYKTFLKIFAFEDIEYEQISPEELN